MRHFWREILWGLKVRFLALIFSDLAANYVCRFFINFGPGANVEDVEEKQVFTSGYRRAVVYISLYDDGIFEEVFGSEQIARVAPYFSRAIRSS